MSPPGEPSPGGSTPPENPLPALEKRLKAVILGLKEQNKKLEQALAQEKARRLEVQSWYDDLVKRLQQLAHKAEKD